jgi:predicted O-methyltransferase YrrM
LPKPLIQRAVRTARAVRAVAAKPPYVTPGHFYSPLTADADLDRAMRWSGAPGVDLAEEGQLALAAQLKAVLAEPFPGPRFDPDNRFYGPADAAVYRGMLSYLRPSRLLEVGSGYSTALVLDEADADQGLSGLEITCIEPFPERMLAVITEADRRRLTLIRKPVQDVEPTLYEQLGPQDILFIDSTHVAKAGSDVIWLFLHILPRLAPGVVVHVHDVFWPFEYPDDWLRQGRDWTEAYLLHAFLSGNADWEMLFFSSWLWRCQPESVPELAARREPSSIWLRKVR